MSARAWGVAGCVLSGIVAAACTAEPPPAPPQYTPVVPQPQAPSLKSVTEATLADAAIRSGRSVGELEVVSAESVTWSDGSLGCPEPGMMYTQALVPGYRIRIRAGEQELDYHAGRNGHFALCPQGQGIEPIRRDDAI